MLAPVRATADPADAPWQIGARIGYARPIGELERGTSASDLSYGTLPIAIDGARRICGGFSAGLFATYAPAIPKLCGSASDCVASFGRDVALGALARLRLPPLQGFETDAEAGAGYLWSSRRLSDEGTASTRSYHGPLLARLAVGATRPMSARFSLGLEAATELGIHLRSTLEAPGVARSRGTDGPRLHGALGLALRFSYSL